MFVIAHNGAHVWGGAERATALLLAGLARRGHRVLLLCGDERVARGAEALGVPTERLVLRGDVALPGAARLALRLRKYRPDAFIVGTYRKLMLAALGARLAGVPRVVARVGLETDTPRSAKYRFVLKHWVDVVVVTAARMRPPFLALPGWTRERVIVIHNSVAPPRCRTARGSVRAALGIAPDAPVIGAVARLATQKRLDRLLQVVERLPPEVHCIIAGEGERRTALERLIRECRLGGRVHLLGHREEVGDVLDALDLMVITSDREGLSNSMLEALAAGVPVVSTPVSGSDEALEPLADGRRPGILTSFDPVEIAVRVRELLGDREGLRIMGEAARERAEERFSFARGLDRWEAVLAGDPAAEILPPGRSPEVAHLVLRAPGEAR